MSVAGVEVNESSRFIDHTLATSWEELVADLEKGLNTLMKSKSKAYMKIDIKYNDMNFILEKRIASTNKFVDIKGDSYPDWLSKNYNIKRYVQFSLAEEGDYNGSEKTTIQSAFATAVRASKILLNFPAFFSFSYAPNFSRSKEVFGYQLLENRFLRFESYFNDQLVNNPNYNYYDGIRQILLRKLLIISPYHDSTIKEDFLLKANFSFFFNEEQISNVLNNNYNPENDQLSYNFLKLLYNLNCNISSKKLILSNMFVDVGYEGESQLKIIDNQGFTTFIPSSQPPKNWVFSTAFKYVNCTLIDSTLFSGSYSPNEQNTGFYSSSMSSIDWMSQCVRRLLALYLFSIGSRKSKVTVEELSSRTIQPLNFLERNSLINIIESLSKESKKMFKSFCPTNSTATNPLNPNTDLNPSSTPTSAPYNTMNSTSVNNGETQLILNNPKSTSSFDWKDLTFGFSSKSRGLSSAASPAVNLENAKNKTAEEDWSEYDFHQHQSLILDFLFQKAIKSPGNSFLTPQSIFDLPSGKLRGNVSEWFGIFAVLAGSLRQGSVGGIARLWKRCLLRLQSRWEKGDVDVLNPPHLISSSSNSTETFDLTQATDSNHNSEIDGTVKSENQKICNQHLWEDEILNFKKQGKLISWPDHNQPIIVQKLQMLLFCTAMKEKNPIFEFPSEQLQVELQVEELCKMAVGAESKINQPVIVNSPPLLRRLPFTEDTLKMHLSLTKKIEEEDAKSTEDHPLLKWKLQIPTLTSHMRAFKAANPATDLRSFCVWYGLKYSEMEGAITSVENPNNPHNVGSFSLPVKQMIEIWETSESLASSDQNPLFFPEKEAEKALAYLEKTRVEKFSVDLICTAMSSLVGLIEVRLNRWTKLGEEEESEGIRPTCEESLRDKSVELRDLVELLKSDLKLLREQVQRAGSKLQEKQDNFQAVGSLNNSEGDRATSNVSIDSEKTNEVDKPNDVEPMDNCVEVEAEEEEISSNRIEPSGLDDDSDGGNSVKNVVNDGTMDVDELNLLMLIDSVAGLLQKLESVCFRAEKLFGIISPHYHQVLGKDQKSQREKENSLYRIVLSLAIRDTYQCQSKGECKVFSDLVKALNKKTNQGGHEWYSDDGRELGKPFRKHFYSTFPAGRKKKGEAQEENMLRVDALVQGDSLRVSFRIPEFP